MSIEQDAIAQFEASESGKIYLAHKDEPDFRAALVAVHLMQMSRIIPRPLGDKLAEGLQHLISNGCPHLKVGPTGEWAGFPLAICEEAFKSDMMAAIQAEGNA